MSTFNVPVKWIMFSEDWSQILEEIDGNLYLPIYEELPSETGWTDLVNLGVISSYYEEMYSKCPDFTTFGYIGQSTQPQFHKEFSDMFTQFFPSNFGKFADVSGYPRYAILSKNSGLVYSQSRDKWVYGSVSDCMNNTNRLFQMDVDANTGGNGSFTCFSMSGGSSPSVGAGYYLTVDKDFTKIFVVRLYGAGDGSSVIRIATNIEANQTRINNFLRWVNNGVVPEIIIAHSDPYYNGGESIEDGGTGDFDLTSDPIDFPDLPTLSAVDTGFITLFNPSLSELQSLANYMWDGSLFDLSTWQKLFADPMDAILGLSIVPVAVPDAGQSNIKVGNIATPISMNKASTQYVTVDCGTINVNEYWGAYLDYEPYSKAEIYLPYCGIHPIAIDDIMGKPVHVKYNVDILSGACCAFVKCGDSVLYSFIGQCASSIPISGTDFTQMINGIISAAVSVGSMVASGGATAPLAVPSLANTAVNSMKPSIEKSGAMGGTGGMLAIQKPYLILTRPKQALPSNQNKYTGYPSYITCNLGDLSGYTEIEKIHLEGFTGTDFELQETLKLLETGVIF